MSIVARQEALTPPATPREALSVVPWLAAVPATTLDDLASHSVLHRMPAGIMLFEQAETPVFMLCLISGSVELLGVRGREETLVELLRAVDLLLPAAILNRQPYLLRARACADARILMVQAETFRDAMASDHSLCLAVLACEAAHFRRQVKHAKNVKLRSAEERVGCYLLKLAEKMGSDGPAQLPIAKRLIASQLGMTRETFSRTLAVVARQGLRVEGDLVIIDDLETARARFRLDPLIDGSEAIVPLPMLAPSP